MIKLYTIFSMTRKNFSLVLHLTNLMASTAVSHYNEGKIHCAFWCLSAYFKCINNSHHNLKNISRKRAFTYQSTAIGHSDKVSIVQ